MKHSKDEIYTHICGLLVDLFEVEKTALSPQSLLVEDLDLDSIDAVDLMIELKPYTGKKVTPEDFKDVKTVQDVVDAVAKLFDGDDEQANDSAKNEQPNSENALG